MRIRRSSKPESGYSLVEVLVVISAASIILTTSATLIHRIMHAQSRAQAFLDVERNALRLSDQFRRDVHLATDVSIAEMGEPRGFTLQLMEGEEIAYRVDQGSVTRVLSHDGSTVSKEIYSFPEQTEWTMRDEMQPHRLLLSAHNGPAYALAENNNLATDGPKEKRLAALWITPVSLHVEACLGRGQWAASMIENGATRE